MNADRFALFLYEAHESQGGIYDLAMIGEMSECIQKAEQSGRDKLAQVVEMSDLKPVRFGEWTYTPLDTQTGLTADRGKIVWKYEWSDA